LFCLVLFFVIGVGLLDYQKNQRRFAIALVY
jgi:hypothetical protein